MRLRCEGGCYPPLVLIPPLCYLGNMTRTEAIAIITKSLDAVDDTTLENAATRLAGQAKATGLTVADIVEAFATNSALPRSLTAGELALIEQSKEDFRQGRTRSHEESMAWVDAELARRRRQRSAV